VNADVTELLRPHAGHPRAVAEIAEVGEGRDRAYGKWRRPDAAVTPP